jgi:hypothetical protein
MMSSVASSKGMCRWNKGLAVAASALTAWHLLVRLAKGS